MRSVVFILLAAIVAGAMADVYLHSPRGQNDRCDEKSNDRDNANRMYNSQNNAAGGYGSPENHEKYYYTDTTLRIEWYSQHACGNGEASDKTDPVNPEIDQCEHILQLGCEDDFRAFAGEADQTTYLLTDGVSLGRPCADRPSAECDNGADRDSPFDTFGDTCTETRPTSVSVTTPRLTLTATCPDGFTDNPACDGLELANGGDRGTFNSATCQCSTRKFKTYGYHEPEMWWVMCRARDRNRGLWISNQNVQNNGATNDRQEPNSARYGFECPEEKDYYPYWHPTPWRDLAIFTSNTSRCDYYLNESQNKKDKCMCIGADGSDLQTNVTAFYYNNELDCTDNNFQWKCFGSWNWDLPVCRLAPHQPDNRLGNVDNRGDNNKDTIDSFASYEWDIPESILGDQDKVRCLIRLRYNISNVEVDWNMDSTYNKRPFNTENPVVTYGVGDTTASPRAALPVRMAINTAQYGRTFEDRTYIFQIRRRPSELRSATIHNLTVRGKRGNIAQVRNCLEYDFVPNNLAVRVGDLVHFQWDGTDYNDNNNAGEGRAGTDRSNVVEVHSFDGNMPRSTNSSSGVFNETALADLAWINQQDSDCFTTTQMLTTERNSNNKPESCHFLNGPRDPTNTLMPTPYYSQIAEVQAEGVFNYMSSRNNNFSNRSQKGTIVATGGMTAGAIAGAVIGSIAGAAIIGAGVFLVYTKRISFTGKFSSRV